MYKCMQIFNNIEVKSYLRGQVKLFLAILGVLPFLFDSDNTISSSKEQIRFLILNYYVEFCFSCLFSVSVVCVIVVVRVFL